ncbi:MAG: methyltransferase [Holophagaceae bacterium]|nr:methyltransferase [Holophagaceae bacterium]
MSEATYKGWTRPGPMPPGGVETEEGETLDYLCGHFRMFQYAKGHRFSVDDLLTGWFGTRWCPRPERIADLGSGIGSVGMVAAWRCPGATIHTVEAQEISVHLARKSARYNGLEDRYHIHLGDLREDALLEFAPFDLVLGSPPYWPVGTRAGGPSAGRARAPGGARRHRRLRECRGEAAGAGRRLRLRVSAGPGPARRSRLPRSGHDAAAPAGCDLQAGRSLRRRPVRREPRRGSAGSPTRSSRAAGT